MVDEQHERPAEEEERRRRIPIWIWWLVGLVVLFALVFRACSGDDDRVEREKLPPGPTVPTTLVPPDAPPTSPPTARLGPGATTTTSTPGGRPGSREQPAVLPPPPEVVLVEMVDASSEVSLIDPIAYMAAGDTRQRIIDIRTWALGYPVLFSVRGKGSTILLDGPHALDFEISRCDVPWNQYADGAGYIYACPGTQDVLYRGPVRGVDLTVGTGNAQGAHLRLKLHLPHGADNAYAGQSADIQYQVSVR